MADIGVAFSPLNNGPAYGNQQQQFTGLAGAPVQEAVKLLSLQMPRVNGAGAIAPDALLNGMGSAGLAGGLQALLQRLFGVGAGGRFNAGPVGSQPMQGGLGSVMGAPSVAAPIGNGPLPLPSITFGTPGASPQAPSQGAALPAPPAGGLGLAPGGGGGGRFA